MKKTGRLHLVITLLAMISTPIARANDLAEDAGNWLQWVGEGSLKIVDPSLEKTRLWVEGQARFNNDWKHWFQGMTRIALGYSLTDLATLWAGYTWLPTQNIGKPYVSQQDVWPGFRYFMPTEFGSLTFRTLVETNFLRGDQVRVRPRQMIRFMHPLSFEPRLNVIGWDEVFVRINDTPWGGQAGFDQNRAFAGLGWIVNPNFRTELGYMNRYSDDASHHNNGMNHLIMGSLFINF